jgi:protein phosphatase
MSLTFSWATFSDKGPRAENQDAVGVWQQSDDLLAVAVADGLGGHVGGRQASALALGMWGEALEASDLPDLAAVARAIHVKIRAEQALAPELRSMATTLSAAILAGNEARVVHCGDSRIALSRGQGIVRITDDHSEALRLFKAGKLTPQEFRTYPRKNILESALGIHGDPRIDVHQVELRPGDRLFFTSDGTHEKIALQELRDLAADCGNAQATSDEVFKLVSQRRPTDNFSFATVFIS